MQYLKGPGPIFIYATDLDIEKSSSNYLSTVAINVAVGSCTQNL